MPRLAGPSLLLLLTMGCAAVGCAGNPAPAEEPRSSVPLALDPPEPPPAPDGRDDEVSGAPQAARTKTLFVHEARVECEGERPMKCLQVRESEDEEWTYFYDTIVGFDYEESYRYELRVEVEELPPGPADRTGQRYRLVEVVKKESISDDGASP